VQKVVTVRIKWEGVLYNRSPRPEYRHNNMAAKVNSRPGWDATLSVEHCENSRECPSPLPTTLSASRPLYLVGQESVDSLFESLWTDTRESI
jgi:hypothetical protein